MRKPDARKENKQLMKVTPKIPKFVLDQERRRNSIRKRKTRSRQSRRDLRDELEEEKVMINRELAEVEEVSEMLDEDLDENESPTRPPRSLKH